MGLRGKAPSFLGAVFNRWILLAVPTTLPTALRAALKIAIQEAIEAAPADEARIDAIRTSFTDALQTILPPDGAGVRDLHYRAAIAAQLDGIFAEIRTARRV